MNEQFFGDWDWLQEILRMSNTGLWAIIVDREQGKCYMHAGNVMLRLLGLKEHPSPEECYQHWYSRIEEKYRMQVKHALEKVIDTGKFLEVQFCWKHPWWGDVFVRCGGRAETREDGQIQIKGYFQNINELELLKQENKLQDAEIEEIKEQKRKYDELFASVLCGIVNYRVNDGKIMVEKINQEALRILHYTEEEFNRRESWDISELIASKDLPYIERGLKKLKKPGDKSGRELRVLTKEGEKRWIIENTELKENRDGSLMFQSVFLDINDDKEKTVLLEEITENIPGGVCLIDLDDFTLLYGNEGYYDLHGCSEQEMKEIYKSDLNTFIRRVDKKRILSIVREANLSKQRNVEFELAIQRPDSRKIWVLVNGTIIHCRNSVQLNCVLVDITDRKSMERELFLNERRLSIALEQTANIVFDFDIQNGRAILKNGNFGPMVPAGIVDNAAENLVTLGILHKDSQKDFMDMWKRVANGSEKESKEILVRYKQGAPFVWTKAVLRTIYTENGVPLRAVGILEDISLQKAAELAFIKEEKYRQAMLAETLASAEINLTKDVIEKTSGIWVRRKRTKNMTYSEILNLVSEVEIYKEDQKKHFAAVNRDALLKNYQQGQTEIKCEYRRVSLDGEVVWVRLTTHLIKEPDSGDIKALVYLRDIDREKRSELTMKYRSERDSLTGLYNKGTAEQKTRLFLESEKRENARHAFIIMDLDHFKIMNDTYGHQYGDEVLKSTASILKDTFRSDDIEGRLGGDEMAVLMKNIPYKGCVEEKLEILKERLLEISREKTPVTVSIGVSFFREHGADYEELYRTADLALYEAKERGRNQFVIYDAGLEK